MPLKKSDINYGPTVNLLKKSVVVNKSYYLNKLPQDLRALAFYISELEKYRQVSQIVRDALVKTEQQGLTYREFVAQFDEEVFKKVSKIRLDVVFRNNLINTYNQSTRLQAIENKDVTPYLMYDATLDDRTRPSHAELDGVIRPVDDPFWDTHTPILGQNCRCGVIPVTKEDAAFERAAKGKKGFITTKSELSSIRKSGGKPDKGFGVKQRPGNFIGATKVAAQKAVDSLPKNSPYREKFQNSLDEINSKVDIWWEKNKNIFR